MYVFSPSAVYKVPTFPALIPLCTVVSFFLSSLILLYTIFFLLILVSPKNPSPPFGSASLYLFLSVSLSLLADNLCAICEDGDGNFQLNLILSSFLSLT
jgi:hypothetical protein